RSPISLNCSIDPRGRLSCRAGITDRGRPWWTVKASDLWVIASRYWPTCVPEAGGLAGRRMIGRGPTAVHSIAAGRSTSWSGGGRPVADIVIASFDVRLQSLGSDATTCHWTHLRKNSSASSLLGKLAT